MRLKVGDPKSIKLRDEYEITETKKLFMLWFRDNQKRINCPDCDEDAREVTEFIKVEDKWQVEFLCFHQCSCAECQGGHLFIKTYTKANGIFKEVRG